MDDFGYAGARQSIRVRAYFRQSGFRFAAETLDQEPTP
jgi:hypothetical protein